MLTKFHERREEEGFTLIELLVVIIIIGILAAIAIPTFLGQRERARRGSVQSDLRNMAINAETYFTDEQTYDDFTEGNDFLTYVPSTDVILKGYYDSPGTGGFCIEGFHAEGAFGDAVDTATLTSDAVDQLPADDGGYWVYDSNANPQLQSASDGGSCAGYTLGSGVGGTVSNTAGILDGRP